MVGMSPSFTHGFFLFVVALSINVNMAFLKASLLLLGGDIESNPGPSTTIAGIIQKVVLGTFHQGNSKFADTAGIQCFMQCTLCNMFFHSKKSFSLEIA